MTPPKSTWRMCTPACTSRWPPPGGSSKRASPTARPGTRSGAACRRAVFITLLCIASCPGLYRSYYPSGSKLGQWRWFNVAVLGRLKTLMVLVTHVMTSGFPGLHRGSLSADRKGHACMLLREDRLLRPSLQLRRAHDPPSKCAAHGRTGTTWRGTAWSSRWS